MPDCIPDITKKRRILGAIGRRVAVVALAVVAASPLLLAGLSWLFYFDAYVPLSDDGLIQIQLDRANLIVFIDSSSAGINSQRILDSVALSMGRSSPWDPGSLEDTYSDEFPATTGATPLPPPPPPFRFNPVFPGVWFGMLAYHGVQSRHVVVSSIYTYSVALASTWLACALVRRGLRRPRLGFLVSIPGGTE